MNDLFDLGAKITATQAINESLDTLQDKKKYIAKLGNETLREKDAKPLARAVAVVYEVMRDHNWHNLQELFAATGQQEALRRMRELRSHGYTIEKRRIDDSRAFEYRLKFDVTI